MTGTLLFIVIVLILGYLLLDASDWGKYIK